MPSYLARRLRWHRSRHMRAAQAGTCQRGTRSTQCHLAAAPLDRQGTRMRLLPWHLAGLWRPSKGTPCRLPDCRPQNTRLAHTGGNGSRRAPGNIRTEKNLQTLLSSSSWRRHMIRTLSTHWKTRPRSTAGSQAILDLQMGQVQEPCSVKNDTGSTVSECAGAQRIPGWHFCVSLSAL